MSSSEGVSPSSPEGSGILLLLPVQILYTMLSAPCERTYPDIASEVPAPKVEPVPPPRPAPAPASAPELVPPPAPEPEPAPVAEPVQPQEYIRYTVKYGDTLWSLARDFCKDPYMYRRIAAENNLKSPDKLISGTTLIIPVNRD